MIPPASIRQKWSLLAIAALFPVTLMGVTFPEPTAQARQKASIHESATLPDDVYLYGNSPAPNQLAHNYVVFERHKGKVVGAFYSPQSEFTCFAGNLQGTRLDVEALVSEEPAPQAVRAQLTSLHQLQRVSANDRRMLTACKQQTIALATRQ